MYRLSANGSIYTSLLNGIIVMNDIKCESALEEHLQKLKEPLKNLRRSYRNNTIEVNYDNKLIQEAYLLGYYPNYTNLLCEVLTDLFRKKKITIPKHIVLFGAGACPEIIGYQKFSSENRSQPKKISVAAIDNECSWQYSIKLIFNNVIDKNTIVFSSHNKDITKRLRSIKIGPSQRLIVIQNMLNEINKICREVFIENLVNIYNKLSQGSFLIIIDLPYAACTTIALRIQENLDGKIIRSFSDGEKTSIFEYEPHNLLKKNLFTGEDLLFRKKYTKYNFLIIEKEHSIKN